MHYYQFNIADYRKDAGHLSMVEHGIYRSLIDWYYLDETPIPAETQVVMRRLRLGSDEAHHLENVLRDFFILTEKGYYHNRIHADLERYQTQFAKNRVNGQRGGRPKKQQVTEDKTQVVISDNQMVSQVEPKLTLTNNQEPITNKIKARSKAPLALTRFAEFWQAYPRRADKAKAEQSWSKQGLDAIADEVIAGAVSYAKAKVGTEPQFIALPSTWLNGKRWQDESAGAPVTQSAPELTDEQKADKIRRQQAEDRAYRQAHDERLRKLNQDIAGLAEGMRP
jgi:uncharacterized protein YdaU (DUF1376 family)